MDFLQDAHPILVHFPIALLVVCGVMSYAGLRYPHLLETTWLLLLIGGLSTIPVTISGLIAHIPYEETALYEVVERHQMFGFVTTVVFLALIGWRWQARRAGADNGFSWPFLIGLTIGVLFVFMAGSTGGDLVYDYAVNVRAVNPLLGQ